MFLFLTELLGRGPDPFRVMSLAELKPIAPAHAGQIAANSCHAPQVGANARRSPQNPHASAPRQDARRLQSSLDALWLAPRA
jgi:hypothetical protein